MGASYDSPKKSALAVDGSGAGFVLRLVDASNWAAEGMRSGGCAFSGGLALGCLGAQCRVAFFYPFFDHPYFAELVFADPTPPRSRSVLFVCRWQPGKHAGAAWVSFSL